MSKSSRFELSREKDNSEIFLNVNKNSFLNVKKNSFIRVTWRVPAGQNGKGTFISEMLFGTVRKYYSKKTKKMILYCYPGLFAKYDEVTGRQIMIPDIHKKRNADYIVPIDYEEKLKEILTRGDVDYMVVPYDFNRNFDNTLHDMPKGGKKLKR